MKKNLTKNIILELVVIALIATPIIVGAQQPPGGEPPAIVKGIIDNIYNTALYILWGLVIVFGLWTGISYMAAGGDEEKLKKAKQRFLWFIIGFAIALSLTVIKNIIGEFGGGTGELPDFP